jgi:hypothetical protein
MNYRRAAGIEENTIQENQSGPALHATKSGELRSSISGILALWAALR